jgi:hypothetical protein
MSEGEQLMVATERCTCTATDHPIHSGASCDRPAVSPVEQVQPGPDEQVGALCLECYQALAVEVHEENPDAVLDLNVPPSFPACEIGLR